MNLSNPDLAPEVRKKRKVRRIIRKRYVKKIDNDSETGNIPRYNEMTQDEQLIHRNSFKLKFDVLRRWYAALNIPNDADQHPDLVVVHKLYELYLSHIYKEINSNFYRGILLLTWLGLELFGTYVLGLDATGYLKQQIDLMWAYEPLINELSSVNFYAITESWTPFQKLLGLILITFTGMIVIKWILSYMSAKTGHSLEGLTPTVLNFISSMVVQRPQATNIPPIIIQTGGASSNGSETKLSGIHNFPIPSASAISPAHQIGLASSAISIINSISGRGAQPVQNQPVQNQPVHRVFRAPTFDS
jgi:hypothetical protein